MTNTSQLYDLFLYDPDSGELVFVVKNVEKSVVYDMAKDYHFSDEMVIKIFDQADGCLVYTLGV